MLKPKCARPRQWVSFQAVRLPLAVCALVAGTADAQNTPATTDENSGVETVVVTGYRASLENAIAEKKSSTGMVDVIKAEDIADFPDANLAESIQRVPGVSIARDGGEGRTITVRGLGPQFTRVRINGMETQSTTTGTDSSGGANRGRGFDFNVFASELFNSITVRKTASADVEEGSLGATVDLQTARPFDYEGFKMAGSAQQGYNDLSRSWDPRLVGLISNRWLDGNLGALLSVAYSNRKILEEGHGSGGWLNGTSVGGYNPSSSFTAANLLTTYSPRFPRYGRLTSDQERLGITSSLQLRPADHTLLTLDILYSDLKVKREEDWLEALSFARPASQGGRPEIIVRDGQLNSRGDLVRGSFDSVDIESEMRIDDSETEFSQFNLSGEHEFTDQLRLTGLVGYSKSDFKLPISTNIILNLENSNGFSYDYTADSRRPLIDYGFDVTDASNFNFGGPRTEIRLRPAAVENSFKTVQLDLAYELRPSLTLKLGANYKHFEFASTMKARVNESVVPQLPAGVTLDDLTKMVRGFGRNLDAPAGVPTAWVAPNLDAFAELFDIYSGTGLYTLTGATNANARGNIRSVTEEDSGIYGQAVFDVDLFALPVRGDVGLRYVETQQSSTGYQLVGVAPVQVTTDRTYSAVLPSLNVTTEITPELLLRFGAAKVMTRPDLGALTPGGSISTTGVFSVTSGNPDLEPIKATTFDLSAEWYFASNSLLSLGLFYKDIKTYIQTSQTTMPFNAGPFPVGLLDGTGVPPTDPFTFRQPVNTKGGPLKGYEISYQQPFTFLPGPLSNFGGILNYTYVDSKIDYFSALSPTGMTQNSLIGLSKNAFNATLYYENDRYSARVSAAYRDRYLTAVPSATSTNDVDGVNSVLTIDASASYAITPRFRLTFEGLNLTDAFNSQFNDSVRNSVLVYSHTGRLYNFGLRYTF